MTHLAYVPVPQRKFALAAILFTAATMTLGCTAGVTATPTPGSAGRGGSGAGTAGTTGNAGSSAGGSGPGIGGFAGTIVINQDAGACQQGSYTFEPKIPTVYLVVDRSGSMFQCIVGGELVCVSNKADTSWTTLKNAIQGVLTPLEAEVRFGFTTIFGTNPSGGGMCPLATTGALADNVPPAFNNAAAIKAKYDSLDTMWPNPSDAMNTGKKFESPASYAIAATAKALTADTTPGDKYIIFITDGQEDYCDDALEICASDSTVGAIQAAFTAGIRTIVFGLQTTRFNLPGAVLDAFANAGAGEATVASVPAGGGLDATAIFDQCQGVTPWRADLTASGHPQTRGPTAVVGTYSPTAGTTKPFKPNAADQSMLAAQLSTALAGVKSCTFDLNNINGTAIKVDRNQLNKASIKVEGNTIPLDPGSANGWNMISDTTLELFGSACAAWRDPNAKNIEFNFPCEIIVD
jgi:hypothetical protein